MTSQGHGRALAAPGCVRAVLTSAVPAVQRAAAPAAPRAEALTPPRAGALAPRAERAGALALRVFDLLIDPRSTLLAVAISGRFIRVHSRVYARHL